VGTSLGLKQLGMTRYDERAALMAAVEAAGRHRAASRTAETAGHRRHIKEASRTPETPDRLEREPEAEVMAAERVDTGSQWVQTPRHGDPIKRVGAEGGAPAAQPALSQDDDHAGGSGDHMCHSSKGDSDEGCLPGSAAAAAAAAEEEEPTDDDDRPAYMRAAAAAAAKAAAASSGLRTTAGMCAHEEDDLAPLT
jgi:hypothetical protein